MIKLHLDVSLIISLLVIEVLVVRRVSSSLNDNCKTGKTCRLPGCLCRSLDPPGRLNRTRVPQLVLFTFTGPLDDRAYRLYHSLFPSSLRNPNGCPIRITVFLEGGATNYSLAADMYETGRAELAVSSLADHPSDYWKNVTYDALVDTAYGLKLAINRETRVPLENIKGFRSPFQQPSSAMYEMLANSSYGFEYDSTLAIRKRRLGSNVSWPFTLDFGWPGDCATEPCPNDPIAGLWEFPIYTLIDLDGFDRINHTEFLPRRERAAFRYLVRNFRTFYRRNRVPFMLSLRPEWLYHKHIFNATKRFITRLIELGENDIYMLSVNDALEWMKHPKDIPDSTNFTAWKCSRTDIDPAPVPPPPPSGDKREQEPWCLSINGVLRCHGGNSSTPPSTPKTSTGRPHPKTIPPEPKAVPPEPSSPASPTIHRAATTTPQTRQKTSICTTTSDTEIKNYTNPSVLRLTPEDMDNVSNQCHISFLLVFSLFISVGLMVYILE